jgi:hypothetical protein
VSGAGNNPMNGILGIINGIIGSGRPSTGTGANFNPIGALPGMNGNTGSNVPNSPLINSNLKSVSNVNQKPGFSDLMVTDDNKLKVSKMNGREKKKL